MSTCPAAHCSRPTNPGWAICRPCAHGLEQALAEIPALADELATQVARQGRRGHGVGPRTDERPLPFDERAAEATWVLRNTLVGWIRDLEPDIAAYPPDSEASLARWLLARVGQLFVHPAAEQVLDEITTAVANAWAVVDNRAERVFLGTCPTCRAEDVHATPGALTATCRGCRATHDVAVLRTALRAALDDRLVTGPEFAGIAITHLEAKGDRDRVEGRVRTWAARGLIAPASRVDGQPRYRFADLRDRLDRGTTR